MRAREALQIKAFDLHMSKFRNALEVRAKLRRSSGFRNPKICCDELNAHSEPTTLTSKRTSKLVEGKRDSPPFLALGLTSGLTSTSARDSEP
jgi:hypothetical protein